MIILVHFHCSKYITQKYSEHFEPMNESVFESFCEDLKKLKLLKGEKFMYFLVLLLVVAIPTVNVFSSSLVSETNIKAEKLKSKIEKQKNTNESLQMQIDELVSMENIQKIADEYGLSYISDNIIKVSE